MNGYLYLYFYKHTLMFLIKVSDINNSSIILLNKSVSLLMITYMCSKDLQARNIRIFHIRGYGCFTGHDNIVRSEPYAKRVPSTAIRIL